MNSCIQKLKTHLANPETYNDQLEKCKYVVKENETIIMFQHEEREVCHVKRQLEKGQYDKYTGIYMVYNEYSLSNIRGLLDVINKKGEPVFFYYDHMDMFCSFLSIYKDSVIFTSQDKFLLFFSENDLATYFSRVDCKYPRIYLNVPEALKQFIIKEKNEEIQLLRQQMDAYYIKQDLHNLKERLKILICSDLFNMGTSGCMARDYEAAFTQAEIDYKLTVEDYTHFHYYEEVYFLRAVMAYKPSAVVAMNVSYASFPYYISQRLPIISQIDSGQYATHENFYRHKGKYTIFLLPFLTLHVMLGGFVHSEIFQRSAIMMPFVADQSAYKQYDLSQEEKEKYTADVCFVGNSTTSKEVLLSDIMNSHGRFFMKGADCEQKKAFEEFLREVIEECFAVMQEKGIFLGHDHCFEMYIIKKINEKKSFLMNINSQQLQRFIFTMKIYVLIPIYRICVTDWVIERGYRVKLYGMRWSFDDKYHKYGCGAIESGEALSKVYNASKIVIHSNIAHSVHRRFFEATLSGCLCICARSIESADLARLDQYFKEDESVVCFSTKQELFQKIEYYLAHDMARRKIVKQAQDVIQKNKLLLEYILSNAVYRTIDQIEEEAEREERHENFNSCAKI